MPFFIFKPQVRTGRGIRKGRVKFKSCTVTYTYLVFTKTSFEVQNGAFSSPVLHISLKKHIRIVFLAYSLLLFRFWDHKHPCSKNFSISLYFDLTFSLVMFHLSGICLIWNFKKRDGQNSSNRILCWQPGHDVTMIRNVFIQ